MNIDIYKSTTNNDKYLSVPEGSDISQLELPADADLDLSKPRMGLDQQDIQSQITEKGYAIHGTKLETSINLTGLSFM